MPALGAVSETGGSSGGDCMRRSPRSRRPQCPVKDARIQERMLMAVGLAATNSSLRRRMRAASGDTWNVVRTRLDRLVMRSTPKGVARLLAVCTGPNELELTN